MSSEAARSFVDRVKSDGEFRAALAAKPDKNARKQFATESGYEFAVEELESIPADYSDDDLRRFCSRNRRLMTRHLDMGADNSQALHARLQVKRAGL